MSRSEQKWRHHVEQQRVSTLTVRAYCQREGLAQSSFYTWSKKFREGEACSPAFCPPAPATGDTPVFPAAPAIVALPALSAHLAARDVNLGPLFVQMGKVRVEIMPNFCELTLRRLLRVLGA